jgi:hypothetical protein
MGSQDRIYTTSRRVASMLLGIVAVLASFVSFLWIWIICLEEILPEESYPRLLRLIAVLAGLPLAFIVSLYFAFHWMRLIYKGLREEVERKVRDQGVHLPLERENFHGIAPSEEYRMYGGDTDWDAGFLLLEADRLLYFGDRIRFALRADQIDKVVLDPAPGSELLGSLRLLLYWSESDTGIGGVLAITPRDDRSPREARNRMERLKEHIERWRSDRRELAVKTPPQMSLPPPVVDEGYALYQHHFSKVGWARYGTVMLMLLVLLISIDYGLESVLGRSLVKQMNPTVRLLLVLVLGNFLTEKWEEQLKKRSQQRDSEIQ